MAPRYPVKEHAARSRVMRGILHLVIAAAAVTSSGLAQRTGRAQDAAARETTTVTIIGGSVSAGMAWRKFESFSPDPDPIAFVEKQFKRAIESREYDLRTAATPIATLIRRLVQEDRIRVRNRSALFFREPHKFVEGQLRDTRKSRLVIGIDLMIWFGYGDVPEPPKGSSREQRAAHRAKERYELQQQGLELLEKYLKRSRAVFVIGDYPDLSTGNEVLLRPHQRPTKPVLAELNRRFYEFADKHERIVVFPMASILAKAVAGKYPVTIAGKRRELRTADVLQFDEIHPNNAGIAALVCEIYAVVGEKCPEVADCLPKLPSFETLLTKLETKVEDLDYLATRSR